MFARDSARTAEPSPRARVSAPPPDCQTYRAAMRQLAGGVCLITLGGGEALSGLTATAVSSLSADPPSLVVCVNRSASSYRRLKPNVVFGLSVLGANQQEIADAFAGRSGLDGAEPFRHGRWIASPRGALWLAESLAAFECEVEDVIEKPTHAIVIGRVSDARWRETGGALVCWRGGYDSLGWDDDELCRAVGLNPPAAASRADAEGRSRPVR